MRTINKVERKKGFLESSHASNRKKNKEQKIESADYEVQLLITKMRFKLSMKPRTLLNVVALLFFVIGLFTLLDEFFKRSNKFGDLPPNQLCYQWNLDANNQHSSTLTSEEIQIRNNLCNIPQQAQFKKFIWVVSDGWPRVFAEEVFQHFGDHSVCTVCNYVVYCYLRCISFQFHLHVYSDNRLTQNCRLGIQLQFQVLNYRIAYISAG